MRINSGTHYRAVLREVAEKTRCQERWKLIKQVGGGIKGVSYM